MSEFIQVKDLKNGVSGIYKINYPNGKSYIGLSRDIRRRIWEHNNFNKAKMPCDLAIKHYGKVTEIEILEYCSNEQELEERESYWIKYYNTTNPEFGYNLTEGGDGTGRSNDKNLQAVFTNAEVLDIRKRRFEGERKKDVYKDYSNHPFATFEKIWLGRGYPDVGQEYIIPTGSISRQEYSSKANTGLKNGRAKMTEEQIRDIRKRFDGGETLVSIHKDYAFVSKSTVNRIAHRQVYKDVE